MAEKFAKALKEHGADPHYVNSLNEIAKDE